MATFYSFETNSPRLKAFNKQEIYKGWYTAKDLGLEQDGIEYRRKDKYKMILTEPRIYFFVFKKTIPASSAKLEDFRYVKFRMDCDDILPPVKAENKSEKLRLSTLKLFDSVNVNNIIKVIKTLKEKHTTLERDEVEAILEKCCMQDIKRLEIGKEEELKAKELQEIAVNAKFINIVRGYGYFDHEDFHIAPHSSSQVKVSIYGGSKQDAVIFRKSIFSGRGVRAAVVEQLEESGRADDEEEEESEEEEEEGKEDEEDDKIKALAMEFKIEVTMANFGQLVANMLKLAADITYEGALSKCFFSNLRIYGLLVNIMKEKCWPVLLVMSLDKQDHYLSIPRNLSSPLDLNEGLHRLSNIL